MLTIDPTELMNERSRELLAEADHERLLAQLPARPAAGRRILAQVCLRIATWLDAPAGYVQMPEAGPEDWVAPWASV